MMLSDCVLKDPSKTELYIIQEGPAVLAAKNVRDRLSHAVLPIGSGIIKISRTRLDTILDNEEVRNMIATLGVGIRFAYDTESRAFDIGKLRYGKIIVATESTPTGRHIRDEIVSFFYRFNRPLLDQGHVFISPLDQLSGVDDVDFEARVMTPETRMLVPVGSRKSMTETLTRLGG